MHIIALGWIYVVVMMAITETSVVAACMTFLMYCALPLGLVWFVVRRKKQPALPAQATTVHNDTSRPTPDDTI